MHSLYIMCFEGVAGQVFPTACGIDILCHCHVVEAETIIRLAIRVNLWPCYGETVVIHVFATVSV